MRKAAVSIMDKKLAIISNIKTQPFWIFKHMYDIDLSHQGLFVSKDILYTLYEQKYKHKNKAQKNEY